MYNSQFDQIIDSDNYSSIKWNRYNGKDVIAMWIADMDFKSPMPIRQAVSDFAQKGIFGYPVPPDGTNQIVVERLKKLYNWQIDPAWIVWVSGSVPIMNVSCMIAGDSDDDEIVVFTPIYPPFLSAPAVAGKKIKTIPLACKNNYSTFDLELFKKQITPKTKMLLLCSPHNPVGRVFSKEELSALAQICIENDILICSDEVHCELLFDGRKHIPTAALSDRISEKTITLMSAGKTFNLGGFNCSFAIIENPKLRNKFIKTKKEVSPSVVGAGYAAINAAFSKCDDWKADLLEYLRQNRDTVEDYINNKIPKLSTGHIEATYLAWIDTRQLGVEDSFKFFEKAGVGLSDGEDFGQNGFLRLNFACSRQLLLKALNRMKIAVEKHLDQQV